MSMRRGRLSMRLYKHFKPASSFRRAYRFLSETFIVHKRMPTDIEILRYQPHYDSWIDYSARHGYSSPELRREQAGALRLHARRGAVQEMLGGNASTAAHAIAQVADVEHPAGRVPRSGNARARQIGLEPDRAVGRGPAALVPVRLLTRQVLGVPDEEDRGHGGAVSACGRERLKRVDGGRGA
jgi:hypothetical protein